MEQQPEYDFDRICRTCKCEATVVRSVFETFENVDSSTHIHEMLMACAAVQVGFDDGLPTSICEKCVQKLQAAYFFKKQCESSDSCLREYAKTMKENDVKPLLSNMDEEDKRNYIEKFINENSAKLKQADQESRTDFIELLENNQMVLTCRECGKVFTTLEGLKCHKRLHTGALFKCKYCDKEYTRQNHLQRHELSHNRRKVHVCRICNKTLTRLEHLKRHLTTHLKEKPFSCTRCKRGFNRSEHLENHIVRCKGDRIHICDICNKGFNRADSLQVHKLLHENQTPVLPTLENLDNIEDHYFEIDYDANTVFSDDNSNDIDGCFEPHVEVTEGLDEKISEPSEADLKTNEELSRILMKSENIEDIEDNVEPDTSALDHNDADNFERDMKEELIAEVNDNKDNEEKDDDVEEAVDMDYDESAPEAGEIEPDDDGSDSAGSEYIPTAKPRKRGRPRKHPIKLPKSPKSTRLRKSMIKKIKKEEEEIGEFPCPSCQEIFSKMSILEKHASDLHPGLKVHKCEVCQKGFSRANHLKRHLLSHSVEKPHICEICTKCFNRKDHLTQHLKLHLKSSDEVCDICFKPFHRADHLAKHKASKHGIGEKIMGEKKFECDVCQKSFTTEKYRDVHVKGHMGMKKFPCKVCEKTFISKSHLNEHQKFHNEHSKKFLCSECGQRFIRNDYLVIHMRRHRGEKPFKCKFCGKGFPRTTDLTVHERYHTGEKTHLCTICGRGFGRAYNLTVHMRTHTGEKPYQCTYCDAAFAQGNDLKAHVRRHTGERFQCELCTESFLMGYLLTQHKRTIHGLNVVSNIRRLQPVNKINPDDPNEPPPITIPLPKPVIPDNILNTFQAPLAPLAPLGALSFAQLQHHMVPE
ncbi:hypothetical protein WA026_003360 [Henosepilachna vigintioctopunctata]|uniref:Uncharacterized protein n=1 Tax=Henosepilachna vigintioctopunctata TaxID=420089 RepID=A0AAW1TIB0_9CUCU